MDKTYKKTAGPAGASSRSTTGSYWRRCQRPYCRPSRWQCTPWAWGRQPWLAICICKYSEYLSADSDHPNPNPTLMAAQTLLKTSEQLRHVVDGSCVVQHDNGGLGWPEQLTLDEVLAAGITETEFWWIGDPQDCSLLISSVYNSVFHNSTFLDIELACNLFPSRFWF